MGGVASALGETAGVLGAPFTGGASLALTAGLATAGGIAGAEGQKTSSSNTSGLNLNKAGATENQAFDLQNGSLNDIASIINGAGSPNKSDYAAGTQSSRDLAALLQQYSQTGGMPTQDQINQANGVTNNLYAARQTALNQSMQDQTYQEQRLAAQLGRPVNDPILQAKMRTGFLRQQDQLSAEEQGTAQQIAMQLPEQQLSYATQRSNLLNQLGGQSLSNQAYLLGLGNQIGNQERNFRVQTAQHYANGSTQSGGGLMGALSGALGGAAGGMKISNGLFGSGGIFNSGGGYDNYGTSTLTAPAPIQTAPPSLMPNVSNQFQPYPTSSYNYGPSSPFNPFGGR